MFSLVRDWSNPATWLNMRQLSYPISYMSLCHVKAHKALTFPFPTTTVCRKGSATLRNIRVIFPNFQNFACCGEKYLKDNSFRLAPKCSEIFVLRRNLFLEGHSFPRCRPHEFAQVGFIFKFLPPAFTEQIFASLPFSSARVSYKVLSKASSLFLMNT